MASLWDAIDDELYRLPPELKDPRFDSLRHVLSIVSSVNAESSVAEVSRTVSTEPLYLASVFLHLHESEGTQHLCKSYPHADRLHSV